MTEDIHWHRVQMCPIVYVTGYCDMSNGPKGRAAFATCWGQGDWRNHHDFIDGLQNFMRAELSGLMNAVALAVREKLPKIVFICKNETLIEELERWENAPESNRLNFSNADLLLKIYKYFDEAKDYIYFLANPIGMQNAGMSYTVDIAKTEAKRDREDYVFHPTPPGLPYRPGTEPKVVSVPQQLHLIQCAIYGMCLYEGQANSSASYSLFFHDSDPNNASGTIENPQTSYRGELTAFKAALNVANASGEPTHLHVFTRSAAVKAFADNFAKAIYMTKQSKLQGGLAGECRLLADKLARLTVVLVNPNTENLMLEAAKQEARAVFQIPNDYQNQSQSHNQNQSQKNLKKVPIVNANSNSASASSENFTSDIYDRLDALEIDDKTPCKIIPVKCRTIAMPTTNQKSTEKANSSKPEKPKNGPPVTFGRQTQSSSRADPELVVRVDCHQGNMYDDFQPRFGRTPSRFSAKYPF